MPLFFICSGVSHGDTCWKNVHLNHLNEEIVRSTKKCFLEVAKVLSVCVYFSFGLCCASFSTGSRDGSLAPPFPERADSPARMVLAPREPPGCCACGVGPRVCGWLSEEKERSAPFVCAGVCKINPRLMQPKFELQVSSLESDALPFCFL